MSENVILLPVASLAVWTMLVLLLIPIRRFRAIFKGQIHVDDFTLGESSKVPDFVALANRNYMSLLELPVLFYLVCTLFYLINGVNSSVVALAWAYVALRIIHSIIHVSYNKVMHRFLAFATGNVVLLTLWIMFVSQLLV